MPIRSPKTIAPSRGIRAFTEERVAEQHAPGQFLRADAGVEARRERDDNRFHARLRAERLRAAPLAEIEPAISRLLEERVLQSPDAGPAVEPWKAARAALREDPDAPLPG